MAHNLETINGRTLAAFGRSLPGWHRLGKVMADTMTREEVLEESGLGGWNLRKEPLTHNGILVPDLFAALRDNPVTGETDVLGVVGKSYKFFQNEETLRFAENIVDAGAAWDTAGSIDKGRRVFASLIVPKEIVLDPGGSNDTILFYLMVTTGHVGNAPLTYIVTPVRVVCQNTLQIALRGTDVVYKVRHTANAQLFVGEARKALNVTFDVADNLQAEAEELIQRSMTNAQFDKIVAGVLGDKPEPEVQADKIKNKAAITRWETKNDLIHDIYRGTGDVMNNCENIRGTAWGGFQALVEFSDYYREVRGDKNNLYTAHIGLTNSVNDFKAKALSVVKELTAV